MTLDLRIPDAGLVWVRRGPTLVASPDPAAGTTCNNHGCKRPRTDGERYCSDACNAADRYNEVRTCWHCFGPVPGAGKYCSPECKRAADSQIVRDRDWSTYGPRDRNGSRNYGTCPTCGATQGRKCQSRNGNRLGRDHTNRPTPGTQ